MARFPSPEWAEKYCDELNKSEDYRKAANTWTAGPIMFVVTDLPDELSREYSSNRVGFILDLERGSCKGVKWTTNPEIENPAFIITAKYDTWLDVIEGRLNPVTALMTMRLKVEKGDIGTLIKYARAAIAMVEAAQRVKQ